MNTYLKDPKSGTMLYFLLTGMAYKCSCRLSVFSANKIITVPVMMLTYLSRQRFATLRYGNNL